MAFQLTTPVAATIGTDRKRMPVELNMGQNDLKGRQFEHGNQALDDANIKFARAGSLQPRNPSRGPGEEPLQTQRPF